jgi:hypothetical protein
VARAGQSRDVKAHAALGCASGGTKGWSPRPLMGLSGIAKPHVSDRNRSACRNICPTSIQSSSSSQSLKELVRKAAARTLHALSEAIAEILTTYTKRMRQLLRKLKLCVNLKADRSSGSRLGLRAA